MIPGFYIAEHECLDSQTTKTRRVKVGHSGDLANRLHNDAYVTNFPEGWRYAFTIEVADKNTAFIVEQSVLKLCGADRVAGRELVDKHPDEIMHIAREVLIIMGVGWTEKKRPVYVRPVREREAADPANKNDDRTIELITDALKSMAIRSSPESADDFDLASLEKQMTAKELNSEDDIGDVDSETYTPVVIEDREFHNEACRRCLKELGRGARSNGRTILQMACRSGKTRVGFMVSEHYNKTLFLVPNLSLLRQTALKIENYGRVPDLLVGSDGGVPTAGGAAGQSRCPFMTTCPEVIAAISGKDRLFVISTYHSAHLLPDTFDLIIFDEAHRLCGQQTSTDAGKKTFAASLDYGGDKLFMTATPRFDATGLSMKNRDVFGSVAYKYHLRKGIDDGIINDFEVRLIPDAEVTEVTEMAEMADTILARQVIHASAEVDKMLVFCKSIAHADELCRLVEALGPEHLCLRAHSKLPRKYINATFARFNVAKKSILFNCRLFQEGVECRSLNAVFFASTRKSPRDIIQTMCRPLSIQDGKGISKIFLPVRMLTPPAALRRGGAAGQSHGVDEAYAEKFSSENKHLLYFADALREEDPSLYEYLLGNGEYNIEWTGKYPPKLTAELFRRTINRKNRLVKRDKLPWSIVVEEIQRSIEKRNRYPKLNEVVEIGNARFCLGSIYKAYAKIYLRQKGAEPTLDGSAGTGARAETLHAHQIFDLESLPFWNPFGAEGPYARSFVIPFLREFLEKNRDTLDQLMINVSNGGYVGLNATPFERLSGYLTTMNQQDTVKKDKVNPEKKAELVEICGRYGLKMFRSRDKNGNVVPGKTYIQECNARSQKRIKELEEGVKTDPMIQALYPGYPEKHILMEDLTTSRSDYSYSKIQQLAKCASRGRRVVKNKPLASPDIQP